MTQSGHIRWALCALVLVMLGPARAWAQQPVASTGGNGIKVGEGRLHLFFDLESRLDSAVGYFPDLSTPDPNDVTSSLSPEIVLRLRPGLKLDVPSSKMAVNASARMEYVRYTGLLTSQSTYGSHLEGAADVTLHFNPEGQIGLVLADQFARSDQSHNAALGAGVLSLFNEARAAVPWKPGGGAVEVTPELAWAVEYFQPIGLAVPVGCTEGICQPTVVDSLDYFNIRAGANARWRFLPKTALLVETNVNVREYLRASNTTPGAVLARAMVGLAGLVSAKIAVTAKVGWGYNFGSSGGNALIAQLEGNYLYSPTMSFKAGYLRTLEPVAAYGLFRDDRPYAEARALLGGKLALHAAGAVDLLGFYSATAPRSDTLFSLDLGPDYQIKPWLIGSAGYTLTSRASSVAGAGLNFTRHEAYLRLSLVY